MKLITQAAIAICFLLSLRMGAVEAQTPDLSRFDLSTRDGINAAREALAGKKLDDRSKNCVHMDSDLPGVVAVGNFAYDRGCRFEGVFVKSHYFGKDDASLSRNALDVLGWKTANPKQREKLAHAWVENGLLGFLTVLSEKNADFADHSFHAPQAISKRNGETVVTLWIRLPSGRTRGRAYQLREYRFSTDGDLTGNRTLEDFSAVENGDR